jgi:hypothetical protein
VKATDLKNVELASLQYELVSEKSGKFLFIAEIAYANYDR